jgi:DNA-directed RNA polymerase subunit RPC12/RpoP
MEKTIELSVQIPCDDNGMAGRKCPECGQEFKVKFGTGLDTTEMYCPYCSYKTESNEFITDEQRKLFYSYAHRYMAQQIQDMFSKSFKNSKVFKYKKGSLPSLYKYKEKELETNVKCNNCGLEYAIYGVFANCPDCNNANQLDILKKSIEVTQKKLNIVDNIDEKDLIDSLLENCLTSAISAFDGFGKGFNNANMPTFQRLYSLYEYLLKENIMDMKTFLGEDDFRFLNKMFQVRHLYEHNLGVIDKDFLAKTKLSLQVGRKYLIEKNELEKLLDLILKLSTKINEVLTV